MQPMQPFPPPPPPPIPGRWPLPGTQSRWPPPSPSQAEPPRETKAAASLALGVLSVAGAVCGVGLTLGLPAIVLGALAHRDIRRGGGAASGGGLATAGIVLGSFGSVLFFGWLAVVMFAVFAPAGTTADVSPTHKSPPAAITPAVQLGGRASIVDLHPAAGALRAQLSNQVGSARRAGEAVLVETSMSGCDPCSEIAQAMPDPTVQQALAKVRLLRVDVAEFRSELAGLRMNEPTVPWFYLLDSRGQPRDAISADEWDDNDADNIAPVLGAFVKGKLAPRRTTWRGRTSL
ncbi:MAG TPA: DUF4190 domain-containing protein [Polyangiaceae bacterium]|nr:DUF4190 domain-containing protein [Polyangiaceae bacterium]